MLLESLLDNVAEPGLSILLMGVPLDAVVSSCLLDVSVTKTFGSADHMSMRIGAWDPDLDVATYIDDTMFAPGAKLAVAMGYGPGLVPVFDGDIVGYEMEMSSSDRPVMSVESYGPLHRLGRGRPAPQTLTNRSFAMIVSDIAQTHRLIPRIEGKAAYQQNERINRHSESDLELVAALADEIGYEFFVDDFDVLVFREAEPRREPVIVITAAEMLQFSGRIDAAGQLGQVEVSAFRRGVESEKATVDNPDSADYAYSNQTAISAHVHSKMGQDELKARAKAELLKMREGYLAVNVTCFGRIDVKVGMGIAIAGVSRRFDGPYTITGLTHSFAPAQGFRTRLTLKGVRR